MKLRLYYLLITLFCFVSCKKTTELEDIYKDAEVKLKWSVSANNNSNDYESHVKKVDLYLTDLNDKIIWKKQVGDEAEVVIDLPMEMMNQPFKLYGIANSLEDPFQTSNELLNSQEQAIQTYNADDYNAIHMVRPNGFLMTDVLKGDNILNTKPFEIKLRRQVAKLNVEVRIDSIIEHELNSSLEITSIELIEMAKETFLFSTQKNSYGDSLLQKVKMSHDALGKTGKGLFYLYPTPKSNLMLKVNVSTIVEGQEVAITYFIDVNGEKDGEIIQNSSYDLFVNIIGYGEKELEVALKVKPWEKTEQNEEFD